MRREGRCCFTPVRCYSPNMRTLIATVFNYSLDGLLADEGTEYWKFCFDLPENREPDDPAQLDFLRGAYAHIMGRTAYEGISGSMTTSTDHPFADILNAGRKVVFSRTLKTADWANTTIAAGDTAEAATATSWSGAVSASGGRSCGST
jgi:dihydrofolate reductase